MDPNRYEVSEPPLAIQYADAGGIAFHPVNRFPFGVAVRFGGPEA
jgi:hypothetical protein